MKNCFLILLFCSSTGFIQAQVQTKTIDSYGVKFIVAEKVPEELKFLMGTYKDVESNETIKLNTDGTISLDGKSFKYWFECTDDNFIAKMPYLDGDYDKIIPKSQQSGYSLINLIVANPYTLRYSFTLNNKTYLGDDSIIITFRVMRMMVNIEDKKVFLNNSYTQNIIGDLQKFNSITKNGPIAPLFTTTKAMCDCISIQEKPTDEDSQYFGYGFEKRLMDMAGANIPKESRETATEKISKWWNKYKTLFYCQSSTFNLEYGNILKFAVVKGFAPFLETIVGTYQMDINYIDPADNRNVLDYVNDELDKTIKTQGSNNPRIKELKQYKELLEDLGAKPSRPVNN